VRKANGEIVTEHSPLPKVSEKYPIFKLPVLRGLGTLGQAMWLGMKALRFSVNAALDEGKPDEKPMEISKGMMAANLIFTLAMFILMYKFIPLLLATEIGKAVPALHGRFAVNMMDGVIRMIIFLGFLYLISLMSDIRRVFEYHGAEHKVVWAFEKTGRMDVETARSATRFHPRCGTSFLLVVMVVAMLFYMVLPFHSFAGKLIGRLVLLPLIAGVSYEFIRFAAKSKGILWRWASQPGLWLQRITTREPDDSQLETAVKALESAMALEKARGGELVIA